jgi:hypothetical protein
MQSALTLKPVSTDDTLCDPWTDTLHLLDIVFHFKIHASEPDKSIDGFS